YKFISDGNWTTDLKAPEFVDDGFGGKNGQVTIADMIGGDASTAAAKINFISWSMIGAQGNYLTRNRLDKTKSGFDLDSATVGLKSYNKFAGNFLPNCPVYIEIALAEIEMEDYDGNTAENLNYLYRRNDYGDETVTWEEGFKQFFGGLFGSPVAYFSRAKDNALDSKDGPGSNPFLGHLKFGFNTPWVKYYTGFNYAKMDVRAPIIWTTIDGNWDAGYKHVGGFNVFSLGDKPAAMLEELAGIKLDVGFAPNKTGDRKGTKYGDIEWIDVQIPAVYNLTIDLQSNGAYDSDYLFYDSVERDFVLGARMDDIELGDLKLNWALQGLLATHQKDTAGLVSSNAKDNPGSPSVLDWSGYSTDVWYRTTDMSGEKLAAAVKVGLKGDMFNVKVGYRMRGMQASMLYLRENHDDGTFDLSSNLGVLNSHAVNLDAGLSLLDGALGINLGVEAEFALKNLKRGDAAYDTYMQQIPSWYVTRRFTEENAPLFDIDGGTELTITPAVTYAITDAISLGVYGDLNLNLYSYSEDIQYADGSNKFHAEHERYNANDGAELYSSTNSIARFKKAGLSFNMKPDSDVVKGVDIYYGFDWSNKYRLFNTLVGQVKFPYDITASLAFGLKTENAAGTAYQQDYVDPNYKYNQDEYSIFSFAVGISKKMVSLKKPTVYAQFCYNMDPYAHFGSGQDNLNMDRSNINGSWAKEGVGKIDPVDWYEGRAAIRVGMRWDI
ncbi:MAG: hypothetical protein HDR52_07490, partial [Treponema sp.]|nr:hypothetical protein [Treponema sp.]